MSDANTPLEIAKTKLQMIGNRWLPLAVDTQIF